jgi:outer membrane receptor protein involved in Fe transport
MHEIGRIFGRSWGRGGSRGVASGFVLSFGCLFLFAPILLPLLHAAPAAAQDARSESADSASADEGLADLEEFDGAEAPESEEELTELNPEDDGDKYRGMEEILVTAQGGTQNLQDVGASVAAFDADYLEALGAQNIADISQFTPNLEIRTVFAASNPTLFIRGVGLRDFNANSSSAVAVYNDDIYMNSPAGQLGQLFDVQQVEVLRGPQGTLYGRNASAGAIRVVTRKPSGDTNGYARTTYGKYNEVEVEGAMEVPVTDTISIRVSGRMRKRDGTTKNRCADPAYKDKGELGTFENAVHVNCFNDQVTAQDIPAIPGPANGFYDANTNSFEFPANPGSSLLVSNPKFYPYFLDGPIGQPGTTFLPWYYQDQVGNVTSGQPDPGARVNPLDGFPNPADTCLNHGGCVYLSDPLLDPALTYPGIPAPYYSQFWEEGVTPTDIKPWVNNVDNWAARALIRWQPSEDVDWVLNIHGGMNRGDSRQFQTIAATQGAAEAEPRFGLLGNADDYYDVDNVLGLPSLLPPKTLADPCRDPSNTGNTCPDSPVLAINPEDGDPYAGDYNSSGIELLNLYGASLTGEFNFGGDAYVFRTITGFEGNEREVGTDLDASPFPNGLEPTLGNNSWQFSQEFKLNWEDDEAWSVETGVNYLYEDLKVDNKWPINTLNYTTQQYTLTTHYASAYAWLDWHPVDDFAITAGGRWNFEVKDLNLVTQRFLPPFSGAPVDPSTESATATGQEHVSANGPSGDITFSYKPTDDRLIFLKYSRGYKGPHINGLVLDANTKTEDGAGLTTPVKPEKVDSLEFGVKTSWFDNQLTVNGAVFYYDYQNIQIFQVRNSLGGIPVNQLINAEDADIYGAEIEVRTHPFYGILPESLDGFELFLSFGWLHSTYTEFVNTISFVDNNGIENFLVEDYSGNRLINSPELAFSGYASWPLRSSFGVLTPRLDWSYKSQVFFSAQNNDNISQDPLWLLNFRIGYTTPGSNIELAGWIRNLTDVAYRGDIINLARLRQQLLYAMGDPRTYGVTLNVRF